MISRGLEISIAGGGGEMVCGAFEEAKCHPHIEDEAVADMFAWDETVAYDEEAQ